MNTLKDIIQRCHKRHGEALRQRKTVVTPALYRSILYHFRVHCARGISIMLDDLEQANISFMPIGHAPENDRGPKDFGGERFLKRQAIDDWRYRRWFASWGIQIYTGIPSEREGARWHDLDFKYEAICAAPEAVYACIEGLLKTTGKPLLTLTKSGGLRFSCRIPNYLHLKVASAKFYTYKHAPTPENLHHRDTYLEILGENGYSRWDTRYEILLGNLLDPPVITKELLFAPIDVFRDALHEPDPSGEKNFETVVKLVSPAPPTLGSKNLNLAKAAFLKRGFSYLREDIGFHHWMRHDDAAGEVHVLIWEDQGVVWVRTATPNAEIPARAVPITDIWDDTGITPPTSVSGRPVTDEMMAVREGKLSPLAIKRPPPTLYRQVPAKQVYGTLEGNTAQIRRVFEGNARVIGVISETAQQNVESYLLEDGEICLNVPNRNLAEATEQRYEALNLPYASLLEETLEPVDRTERIYIIDERTVEVGQLFLGCQLSKDVLEAWVVNWRGNALGSFAETLLNALESQGEPNGNPTGRVRAAVEAFQHHEDVLTQQMCHINVPGTEAIELGILDAGTVESIQAFPIVCPNPNWTYWHQLKRFFAHYTRDADAPMRWTDKTLQFHVPPVLHPGVKRLLLMSPMFTERHLRRIFPNEEIEVVHTEPIAWMPDSRVFQLRTGIYSLHTILNYDSNWDVLGLSKVGERLLFDIRAEIDRDPSVKHAIITNRAITRQLTELSEKKNVCFVTNFKELNNVNFEAADIFWILGVPHWGPNTIWRQAQMLFGNDEEPLYYEGGVESVHYKDERIQAVYHQNVVGLLSHILGQAGLNRQTGKTVVLLTSIPLPDITDRPETLLFDWEDFEVAGELDKLPEVIATREGFEAESAKLTAESNREEVERVLGCSERQANRVLQRLRGGNSLRVNVQEQLLALLADGEKRTSELVAAIDSSSQSVGNGLRRLVDTGEIVKVQRGVYKLPEA